MNADTQSIVERVGRAVETAWNDGVPARLPPIELTPDEWDHLGRTAIGAMHEPTEAMVEAAHDCLAGAGDVSDVYRAMLTAALSEPGK